ncbi:MAG TPA: hypothetical protein VF609_07610, partial [Flavisolibacter sp.]
MSTSLFQINRFRIAFGTWWCCWAVVHFIVLNQAGFSWQISLYDSLICNLLLAATASLVAMTLQYYLPEQNKYGYLSGLCVVLSVIWLSLSRALLLMLLKEGSEYESFFSQSLLIRGATG